MYSRLSLNSNEKEILRNALVERKELNKLRKMPSLFLSYVLGFLHRQVVSPKTHSTQSHPSPHQQHLSLPGKRGTAQADGRETAQLVFQHQVVWE